ncbi:hypothetical protein DW322_03385 [Rhodococcus rhodnii]|uniref:Uncharacterized protein n=2 Tax=Rhodococcus rhodnii TaxID=38312 RepID=R7WHL1_9NOCA|nr:hypothetical protein [Rhodococcus rhodnii]EOM74608.1 hypothetical protein Rrhod_4083 [Rhodococcus rhodnii LMG 5362]TXG89447.1 hypothetical protein DW322_03385 [Rhodococcus rhodnii]
MNAERIAIDGKGFQPVEATPAPATRDEVAADTPEQAWARHYLQHVAPGVQAALGTATRQAERQFRAALADQPWVQALVDLAAAKRGRDVASAMVERAHAALGSEPPPRNMAALDSIAGWHDGQISPDFLARPIAAVVDDAASERIAREIDESNAAADTVIADSEKLAELRDQNAQDAQRAADDPVARVRLGGGRMEVDTVDIDGTSYTRHFNLDTNESVIIDADGNEYRRPQQFRAPDSPPDWTT